MLRLTSWNTSPRQVGLGGDTLIATETVVLIDKSNGFFTIPRGQLIKVTRNVGPALQLRCTPCGIDHFFFLTEIKEKLRPFKWVPLKGKRGVEVATAFQW